MSRASRWVGRGLFAALALLLAANIVWIVRDWAPLTTVTVPTGAAAPDLRVALLDGNFTRIADARGRVLVLNFWATWCPPCREELPGLERVFERYRDRVNFLAVSTEGADARALVARFAHDHNLRFPIALDDGLGSQLYHVDTIPQTFVIDGAGRVARHFHGAVSESDLARALDDALAR